MTYEDEYEIDVMKTNVNDLANEVVGHKIVKAGWVDRDFGGKYSWYSRTQFEIELDNGRKVYLANTDDCCAYTELNNFLLNAELVDHMIMGVEAEDHYHTWHIYADMGDVLALDVSWSSGNTGYYGFGFNIEVVDA
jgi:hypothetical protein